jgi:hypothetical protein
LGLQDSNQTDSAEVHPATHCRSFDRYVNGKPIDGKVTEWVDFLSQCRSEASFGG